MEPSIVEINRRYWNDHAAAWFGATALPEYGVRFPTEEQLHLFGDVSGKKLLDICCGSGHSLNYHGEHGAGELWGVDLSQKQLEQARGLLEQNGHAAKLLCGAMEEELDIPKNYFDAVYSIYGMGWTTDLDGTFQKVASYLKKDGVFIFSWHHPLNYCVSWTPEGGNAVTGGRLDITRSYFDEGYFTMPVDGSKIVLCNRKISTYVNALAKAGFVIEQMVEQNAPGAEDGSPKAQKARFIPLSMCFKARKA